MLKNIHKKTTLYIYIYQCVMCVCACMYVCVCVYACMHVYMRVCLREREIYVICYSTVYRHFDEIYIHAKVEFYN